jgi:hypothetical protein
MRISMTAGILSATAILAVAVAAPANADPAVIEVVPDGSRASSPASPNNFTGKADPAQLWMRRFFGVSWLC